MKKQIFAITAIAALVFSSCGMLKGNSSSAATSTASTAAASSASDAAQMGKNAGSALDYLAAQYKSAGKLDMTNMMNIASMLNLVGAAQQVYQNKSDKTYILIRSQMIEIRKAQRIVDVERTKLNEAMQKGQATAAEVENVAGSVTNIISMFKK